MPKPIIEQIIDQHRDRPDLVGSLACHLGQSTPVAQQHRDGREFEVFWSQKTGFLRCTIFIEKGSENCIAQVDIHEDKTIRVEAHEPVSITIDPKIDVLVLVRIRQS